LGDPAAYGQQDACAVTFIRMQLLGKLLIAENLRDSLWALEWLARDARVDANRLACVGLSYGGRMAMLTAALEPRIRAAVVSGALKLMQERVRVRFSCGAQVIPGLLQHGDVAEIGSLIAPRMPGPIRIGPGSGDPRGRGLGSICRPRPALSPVVRRSGDTGWADALTQRPSLRLPDEPDGAAQPPARPAATKSDSPEHQPDPRSGAAAVTRSSAIPIRRSSPTRRPFPGQDSLSTHHTVEAGPSKGKCEYNVARMAPKSPRFWLACHLQSASGLQKPIHTG
jgi:pimeloyl-ACP methyl ester carboxylesterase